MKPSVEAIILAGGKGTRLAPLTEDMPKPMLKIMGKTVLENVYERLSECGVEKACVTTGYLPWQIESCGNIYKDIKIDYVREKSPLGTAGAVRHAYDGKSDIVMVLSGDGLYDFDLKKALEFHLDKNADVTIVTYNTDNPLEYGVVLYDTNGRITRFTEKPPWAQVVSGTVNTGIYILNKSVVERIPKNTEYDFGKQLFPLLLAQKYTMFAYEATGIWHDIGNLDGFFQANCSALDGKIRNLCNEGLTEKELRAREIDVEMPVYVSKSAVIGRNVKLGAYSFISDEAVISDNCDISCSVIGDKCMLGMGCGIYGTIMGRNVRLGENCVTSEGCAIGSGAEIEDSVILPKYSFVHSTEKIHKNEYRTNAVCKKADALFSDGGIECDIQSTSPEFIMRIGLVASNMIASKKGYGSTRIGIMHNANTLSKRVADIILDGVRASGVRSIYFSQGFEAMARFACVQFITDMTIFVNRADDGRLTILILDQFGFPISGSAEREFTSLFFTPSEYVAPDRFYEPDKMENMWTLYYNCLARSCKSILADGSLKNFVCAFSHKGEIPIYSPEYTAICLINELGGEMIPSPEKAQVCFDIDKSGNESKCICRNATLDYHHLNVAIIKNYRNTLCPLYLSSNMPSAYKNEALKKGIEVIEYASSSPKEAYGITKNAILNDLWLYDGVYRTLVFACVLKMSGADTYTLFKKLPSFEIYSKSYDYSGNRAHIMQNLAKISAKDNISYSEKKDVHEGIRLNLANGCVTIIPKKINGFKIISEAESFEAAKELCGKAQEYLK